MRISWPGMPELQKFPQIARPLHHLPGHRAVDGDPVARDIFQDSIVGRRGAPDIVFGLQAVDRDSHGQVRERSPGRRRRTESAGDDLHVDAPVQQQRNHRFELAIPDQRVASHQRQMQRPQAVGHLQHSVDQLLSLAVAKAAQRDAAAQVPVLVGVASGAPQRALPGDFDRKGRPLSLQNPAPRFYNHLKSSLDSSPLGTAAGAKRFKMFGRGKRQSLPSYDKERVTSAGGDGSAACPIPAMKSLERLGSSS